VLGRELSNGRICDVLESRSAEAAPYAAVRSWVDAEQGVILSAEAYDTKRVRLKRFSVTNFQEVADQWTFSLSIVDDRRGTKTELSYETVPQR
jgi:outer membrane lipoprotein-sorting protein